MSDTDKLLNLISKKSKLVAMVAPSFAVMYEAPDIVKKLRSIGFTYVVEVAVGAKQTNIQAVSVLQNSPHTRFITSPCASFVRYMRTKHPDLLHYVAFEIDSPMVATTKIVREKWPGCQPVFIGPCLVKKLEALQDHPELGILVLTYREIEEAFKKLNVQPKADTNPEFDMAEASTRTYPIDGGLTDTSGARNLLKEEEIRVVSGLAACEKAIQEFDNNKSVRLLDILFCDGGCIMGPGIQSTLNLGERKARVQKYASGH